MIFHVFELLSESIYSSSTRIFPKEYTNPQTISLWRMCRGFQSQLINPAC